MIARGFAALSVLLLAGCVSQPELAREGTYDRADTLFDPARAIQQDWTVMPLAQDGETRETDYRIASHQDRLSIRAEGQRSATGLALAVDLDVETCPYLEWDRTEEHTSELQSLMRISDAVFCLKKIMQASNAVLNFLIKQTDNEL